MLPPDTTAEPTQQNGGAAKGADVPKTAERTSSKEGEEEGAAGRSRMPRSQKGTQLFKRPRGRAKKGKIWDFQKGYWKDAPENAPPSEIPTGPPSGHGGATTSGLLQQRQRAIQASGSMHRMGNGGAGVLSSVTVRARRARYVERRTFFRVLS